MTSQTIRYQIIGRAVTERQGAEPEYALKLLYRGDGTPWWTCSGGMELLVSKPVFDAAMPGGFVQITIAVAGE